MSWILVLTFVITGRIVFWQCTVAHNKNAFGKLVRVGLFSFDWYHHKLQYHTRRRLQSLAQSQCCGVVGWIHVLVPAHVSMAMGTVRVARNIVVDGKRRWGGPRYFGFYAKGIVTRQDAKIPHFTCRRSVRKNEAGETALFLPRRLTDNTYHSIVPTNFGQSSIRFQFLHQHPNLQWRRCGFCGTTYRRTKEINVRTSCVNEHCFFLYHVSTYIPQQACHVMTSRTPSCSIFWCCSPPHPHNRELVPR